MGVERRHLSSMMRNLIIWAMFFCPPAMGTAEVILDEVKGPITILNDGGNSDGNDDEAGLKAKVMSCHFMGLLEVEGFGDESCKSAKKNYCTLLHTQNKGAHLLEVPAGLPNDLCEDAVY